MKRIAALTVSALLLAGFVGCEKANDNAARRGGVQRNQGPGSATTTTPSTSTPSTSRSGMSDSAVGMHTQMVTTWKSQISDLQTRVQGLENKLNNYTGPDKDQLQQQYRDLRQEVDQLNTKVQNFNVSDTGSFDQFRGDIESQMNRINQQLRDLDQKLSQAPTDTPSTTPSDTSPSQPTTPDNNPSPR